MDVEKTWSAVVVPMEKNAMKMDDVRVWVNAFKTSATG
jgi:hypothetical protein